MMMIKLNKMKGKALIVKVHLSKNNKKITRKLNRISIFHMLYI